MTTPSASLHRSVRPPTDERWRESAELYWRPMVPSRWRWPRWPMAIPVGVVLACMLLPLPSALAPDMEPGRYDIPQRVRDQAALLWVLCWLPTLHYLLLPAERRRPIPFLPVTGILFALYYALSPMLGLDNMMWGQALVGTEPLPALDAERDYLLPVRLVLLGWLLQCAGYLLLGLRRPGPPKRVERIIATLAPPKLVPWALLMIAIGQGAELLQRVVELPAIVHSLVPFSMMLSHASMIVLIVMLRRGQLSRVQAATTVCAASLAVFIQLGGGATSKVIQLGFALCVGLWIGRGRIPVAYIAGAALAALSFVAIRGAMTEWRAIVWFSGIEVTPLERSRLMVGILARSVETEGVTATVRQGWRLIAHRSANTDLLADVIRRTPHPIPFWDGYTYRSLIGAFVPRLLWPDKPMKTLGQDFGHRYAYLNPWDRHTSINLPLLVEFFANFGELGVLIGMLLVGGVTRGLEHLCNRPGQSLLMTAAGTQLLSQLFVMECDFSQQYGGLLLQLGALAALLAAIAWTASRARTQMALAPTLVPPRWWGRRRVGA